VGFFFKKNWQVVSNFQTILNIKNKRGLFFKKNWQDFFLDTTLTTLNQFEG
jgi:hypothetical protein